jgi:hypothetical protein
VRNPEGKRRLLGRSRLRWKVNIETEFRETGLGDNNWIDLAKDMDQWRDLVTTVMNLWVP